MVSVGGGDSVGAEYGVGLGVGLGVDEDPLGAIFEVPKAIAQIVKIAAMMPTVILTFIKNLLLLSDDRAIVIYRLCARIMRAVGKRYLSECARDARARL